MPNHSKLINSTRIELLASNPPGITMRRIYDHDYDYWSLTRSSMVHTTLRQRSHPFPPRIMVIFGGSRGLFDTAVRFWVRNDAQSFEFNLGFCFLATFMPDVFGVERLK